MNHELTCTPLILRLIIQHVSFESLYLFPAPKHFEHIVSKLLSTQENRAVADMGSGVVAWFVPLSLKYVLVFSITVHCVYANVAAAIVICYILGIFQYPHIETSQIIYNLLGEYSMVEPTKPGLLSSTPASLTFTAHNNAYLGLLVTYPISKVNFRA